MNTELRKTIVNTITNGGEGHIPSSFSVIDIIDTLYANHLKYDSANPEWTDRDYFILSKGHAGVALYVVLEKYGFITQADLDNYGKFNAMLGGHPDRVKIPGVEASTGSLGHGFPYSVGIALGHKINKKENKVFVLVGDGESHEGTVWESALVAQNLNLENLCLIVDYNGSAAQIMPHPNIIKQWESFGWNVLECDGHNEAELDIAFNKFSRTSNGKPTVIIARTIKGKGVRFMETHGPWHHKIPNPLEYAEIMEELSS
ncbi:MAG: transketolase [Candidatus Marinimicrobia bacterium]|nr:transketolase [Candidatus Neomarinimicrobiota bacterium]